MHQHIVLEDAAFVAAVVKEGGVAAAARSLGLPKSTVSRRLRALQDHVRLPLFGVKDGALRPTEAGLRLAERFASVIHEAEDAHQSVSFAAAAPRGSIRLLAPTPMGPHFLGDLVASFLVRHPEVRAEVELTDRLPEIIDERFDVIFQLDTTAADLSMITRRLGSLEQILCAAPSFLAAQGTPRRPEDLAQSRAVVHGEGLTAASFELRVRQATTTVLCPARLTVNHATAVYRAVLAGLGIGALPLPLIRADLAQGRLVRVLPDAELAALPLVAVVPSRRHLSPVVRALLEHASTILSELTDPGEARLA